ncbi:S9 family peptidase [Massilia pinisoli]|uniref:S9 family peptidase n=2 Tax=Massilia pinisoli TaxID=1772194 RepID=A0ABT1ZQV6_9BURK|nr:S9 family peptidase [Massilia pinisoli]
MRLPALAILAALLASPVFAATPVTLDEAMANPDWIGTPVEAAWWSWDGKQVFYKQKRTGSPLRDTWHLDAARGGRAAQVADADLAKLDSPETLYNRARTRAVIVRNGDLFERDLKNGALVQITRSQGAVQAVQYSADERSVQFRIGDDWFGWDRNERVLAPLALARAAKDPNAQEPDALRDMQLRLSTILKRQKDERDATRAQAEQERRADPTRAPAPIYLGDKIAIVNTALSPDGRWLLVVTGPKDAPKGRVGKMPRYVTESGYEEFSDERTRVGRNPPAGQGLKLVNLATHEVQDLALDVLPGIATDPLAQLRAAHTLDPLKGLRPVTIGSEGEGIVWSQDGGDAAVQLRAVDNKDRWIATVDLPHAALEPVHRLTEEAWVNYDNNDFGWLPDGTTLWYLSEETGYSHLYVRDASGRTRALTQGAWEATDVAWSADGRTAWLMCNRKAPHTYEVCAVDAAAGVTREVSSLAGVQDFRLSPDQKKLLVHYSGPYLPAQLATLPASGGDAVRLTDTRTPEFKAHEWIQPQFVTVPSTHGGAPIWAKLYRPAQLEPGKKYPVVMFVHGAGYLQNVTQRYTPYFREQMFHNLLVQNGYVVLDMDYRASKGYGVKWRTAIYRQMGHPELDDYLDGVNWMVANEQGDPARVGIYGGSYGGFMTLMGMLRAPDVFKAGAALRPVSDWTSYNHEYTSNILNTPDVDPEAYKVSSPIEYAQNLKGHLLIAHGMVDDNVFFQDSVRMAERLIELKKDHWELAPYPLEKHSFVQPESWYDEYRRIFQLFENTLKP